MKNRKFKYKYAITARASGVTTCHYVNSITQGKRMSEFSHSIAYLFSTKFDANDRMSNMMEKYQGLTDWKLEYRKFAIESPITKITINS